MGSVNRAARHADVAKFHADVGHELETFLIAIRRSSSALPQSRWTWRLGAAVSNEPRTR
jgi:hypothetical protein